jgi:oxygen-independent coproporphyrinogen-3 oxidase
MAEAACRLDAPSAAGEPGAGFGLYVHWPFCAAKCPYCDFNSHVAEAVDHARWADALCAEVTRVAARTPDHLLTSIFFGGGTPSLMAPETVARVIEAAHRGWRMSNDLEITLEANPTSSDATRFAGFAAAGVTRLSLGVQALNDADLRRLGRQHSAQEALAAVSLAREKFERVSFDLICARQHQTRAAWEAELRRALDLGMDHLSLYQLTIEPGTAFARRHAAGGLHGLPDEDLSADLYEATVALCAGQGLDAYEISNFARPGAECRHNLTYWRGGDHAGIGPGAHGRLTLSGERVATEQPPRPGAWLEAAEAGNATETTQLSFEDQYVEYVLMGLRKREGLHLETLARLEQVPGQLRGRAASLRADGLLWETEGRLGATARGRLLLDSVTAALLEG